MVEIQSKLAQRREQERAELDGSVDGAEIAAVSDSIAAGTLQSQSTSWTVPLPPCGYL